MTYCQQKKKFERWVIDLFVSTCPDLLSATIVNNENPDFLARFANKTIGLELTCLYNEPRAEHESAEQRVIQRCKRFYDEKGFPPVHVNIMFVEHRFPRKRDADIIAEQIVKVITSHIPCMNEHIIIRRNNKQYFDNSQLPRQIAFISLDRFDVMDHSFFGLMDGGFAIPFTTKDLQDKIMFKNCRVPEYLDCCDEVWLVIAYDIGGMKSLFKMNSDISMFEYESNFKRVFLFNRFAKSIVELKTRPASKKAFK